MSFLDNLFDTYGRKARLYPAFLALLPAIMVVAVLTDWLQLDWSSAIWLIVASAALLALADFSRQRGKAVEKKLLPQWEGFPSKTLLRHRDDSIDPQTTQRYHRAAENLITGLKLPTVDEEKSDSVSADHAYESVAKFLLPQTRDKAKFALLFSENVNYGFRRNLLGLKPIAIILILGAAGALVWSQRASIKAGMLPDQISLGVFAVLVLMLIYWTFFVTADRVKEVAEDYAKQLLMTLDVLDSKET